MEVKLAEGHGSANISNGDLILVNTSARARPYVMIVGDVTLHEAGHVSITPRNPAYRLLPPELSLSLIRRDDSSVFGDQIREVYSGKDIIAQYCEGKGWNEHVRWIRRLEDKVETLPKMVQLSFIP